MSNVSVSLLAGLLHFGQLVFKNSGNLVNGDFPSDSNFTFSGSKTGKSVSGTGTVPQSSQ